MLHTFDERRLLVEVLTGLCEPVVLESCDCEDDTDAPLMLPTRLVVERFLAGAQSLAREPRFRAMDSLIQR
jgi:hypothetical protein